MSDKPVVIVGVDGSHKDELTVTWAARAAARRGARLHVLYAFKYVGAAYGYGLPPIDIVELGDVVTAPAVARAREAHPDLEVTAETIGEDPAVALVKASQDAVLVVVGARGLGRIASRIVGSVSQKVGAQAACPVTVVRGQPWGLDGPVVVGVDPGDVLPDVVDFGFRAAAARGVGVRLLAAFDPAPPDIDIGQVRGALADAVRQRTEELEEMLGQWRERHPDVPAELDVVHTDAVDALVEAADTAGLLVVGSRGRRGLTGRRLGSVAQSVLHVAPVVSVLPIPA